jgi:hypothetical protein
MKIYIVVIDNQNLDVCTCFDLAKLLRKKYIRELINGVRTYTDDLNIDPSLSDIEKEQIILSTAYNSVGIQIYEQGYEIPLKKLRYIRTDRLLYTSKEAH